MADGERAGVCPNVGLLLVVTLGTLRLLESGDGRVGDGHPVNVEVFSVGLSANARDKVVEYSAGTRRLVHNMRTRLL